MAGIDNDINFGQGYRLEDTPSSKYPLMQENATDVGQYNNAGSPEGVISANPGSLCHDRTNGVLYYKNTGTGNTGWVLIPNGSTVGLSITGNSGPALNPTAGNWDILGSGSFSFSGSGSTLTGALTGLTNHSVLVGAGTDTITKIGPVASTGSVFMSNGLSSDPGFSTATYPLTTTINQLLYSSASNVVSGLVTANDSLLVTNGSGVPAWTAKSAFGQTITGNFGGPIAPSSGNWNVVGSGSFSISGSGSTLTGELTGLTNHAVLVGAGSDTITKVGPTATAGQIFQSGGLSADPSYSTATYPSTAGTSGKVLISDGTNIVSSTPTFPNASATSGKFIRSDGTNWIASTPTLPTSAGTSGKVLQSDGTNYVESTPTYPSTSGSAGKIIRSDGTNNLYTTAAFPDTAGTSGNVLTSDGTNWVSSSASGPGGLTYVTITLTNSQIKNLRATPIQVVAAPGSGKVIVPVSALGKLIYGGTNAFTASSQQNITFTYGSGTTNYLFNSGATQGVINNATLVLTATSYSTYAPLNFGAQSLAASGLENAAIYATNAGSAEIGGNGANNNTVSIAFLYYIVTL